MMLKIRELSKSGPFSLSMVLFLAIALHASQISIAVSDLEATGVDANSARIITERIRVELTNTKAVKVLERSQMHTILGEQGFMQTGCVDNSCAIEIGQLLGVQMMCIGTIGKIGSLYSIALRLVDVGTGSVQFTVSEDCQCPIEGVLQQSAKSIALKLANEIEKAAYGEMTIVSQPQGADVILNGRVIGKTNYNNDKVVPGNYKLEISLPTYTRIEKTITILQNEKTSLEINLEHTKDHLDSVSRAARLVKARKLILRQLVFAGLAGGTGALGYKFNNDAARANERYRSASNSYLDAPVGSNFERLHNDYQNAEADVDRALLLRNVLYGVSGAFTLTFGISFFF